MALSARAPPAATAAAAGWRAAAAAALLLSLRGLRGGGGGRQQSAGGVRCRLHGGQDVGRGAWEKRGRSGAARRWCATSPGCSSTLHTPRGQASGACASGPASSCAGGWTHTSPQTPCLHVAEHVQRGARALVDGNMRGARLGATVALLSILTWRRRQDLRVRLCSSADGRGGGMHRVGWSTAAAAGELACSACWPPGNRPRQPGHRLSKGHKGRGAAASRTGSCAGAAAAAAMAAAAHLRCHRRRRRRRRCRRAQSAPARAAPPL